MLLYELTPVKKTAKKAPAKKSAAPKMSAQDALLANSNIPGMADYLAKKYQTKKAPIKKKNPINPVEQSNKLKIQKLYPVATSIVGMCKPFLESIKYNLIKFAVFRGLERSNPATLFKIPCPIDRSPRDTEIEQHKAADDWFLHETGIRYRSNALFGTGSYRQASDYGIVYAMFPIGDFNFCYSPIIDDLTGSLEDPVGYADDYDEEGEMDGDYYLEMVGDHVWEMMPGLKYQHNTGPIGLQKGILSRHEIMFNNKQGAYMFQVGTGFGPAGTSSPILDYLDQAIQDVKSGKTK